MVRSHQLRIHVVFNNVPWRADLRTSWGAGFLIEQNDSAILFDTGGDGEILLWNMERLDLDIEDVETVVLSHIHADHTGGLEAVLRRTSRLRVFVPGSFPGSFIRAIEAEGAVVERVTGPLQLENGVYSTGEMGSFIKEQALVVNTPDGLVVITGCAHPNPADMALKAQRYLNEEVYLLMGGFHMRNKSDAEILATIERLKDMGVQRVAPSHCTGDRAMTLFRNSWGQSFWEGGLGAIITIGKAR